VKRIVLLAALLVLPACQGGHGTARRTPASGPLAGLRWPAGAVRAGMLLHDDGLGLWSYQLDGRRRLLWRHAPIRAEVAAAAPDGSELAYFVYAHGRQFLYLLSPDGRVHPVDAAAVKKGGWLDDASFLRPSTTPRGRIGLYWVRSMYRRENSLDTIRVLRPDGSLPVAVALRTGEYPYRLAGYPGSPLFTLTLIRRVTPPPGSLLVLPDPSQWRTPARVGDLLPLRETDNRHPVAWLSPTTFVLRASDGIRLFDQRCFFAGSKVVYSGRGIDLYGVDEGLWPIVPVGRNRVLVMASLPASATRDEAATMRANERPLHWAVLDLRTRRLARTKLIFHEAGWVYVQPARPFREQGGTRCAAFDQPPW
jgi:hypothetical protein